MSKSLVSTMLLSLVLTHAVAAQEPPAGPAYKSGGTQRIVKAPKVTDTKPVKAPAKAAVRADRLDLETTVVSGNRELPKVLYIVPWKKADLGELPAQPFNTLLDEVLAPVDRDVFKREVKYFHAVTGQPVPGGGAAKAAATPPSVTPP